MRGRDDAITRSHVEAICSWRGTQTFKSQPQNDASRENWGSTDNSCHDIAPDPMGEGLVDAQDLLVLREYTDQDAETAADAVGT